MCRDPVEGHWIFLRAVLDAWWGAHRTRLIAALSGASRPANAANSCQTADREGHGP
jgi:hypothetical protein